MITNPKEKYWTLFPKNIEGKHVWKPTESYLKVYFNIMYYLLFVPFKIQTDKTSGDYILVSNRFQKFCCAVVYVFVIAATVAYYSANFSLYFNIHSNISQLMATVGSLSGSAMAIVAAHLVWFRQAQILKFLCASKVDVSSKKVNALVFIITMSKYGFQLACSFVPNTLLNGSIGKTLNWIREYTVEEQENAFLRQAMILGTKALELILIQGCAMYIMPRLLLIIIFIQLKQLGKQFEKFVESEGILKSWTSVQRVIEEFDGLRKTVNYANSWIGGTLLSVYVCVLAMLANLPGSMRDEHETTVGLMYTIIYTGTIGVAMVIGSDLPMRVRLCSKRWITYKRLQHELSQREMSLLLAFSQDVDCGEPIGLSCPFFTVTYTFVGSMIGLLTTYGVIVLQMSI